ncbi:hypothetical protein QPK31_02725 [Massilia sp. YIM B02769]|uniref:hypothetical protein n=1 Tax=Massilia sp. YIM B02769 TaxID=3050129 RepID=UPI0025B7060C|nr:hypothetical protein [Massilia sp. YIM B02769]MDN4057131.1 hypothetical protein [Massilia sp. YIM B02769]
MSGERIAAWGTVKVLESSGAMIANAAVVQASAATYSVELDGQGYPDADFALVGTFGVAPVESAALLLYARPLDIDGTKDTEVPEASRPTLFVGSFVVNNATTEQAMLLTAYGLPRKADYYVYNSGTGQSLAAGWTLKITPRTEKLAP